MEAAEAVGAGSGIEEDDVLELLLRLVEKSLVVTETSEGSALRYRMLEPIRQYAQQKLEESGEAERVRERHARYYLALTEVAEPELKEQGAWLERLGAEHANFRAALSWTLDPEDAEERAQLGLRLAAALAKGRFWAANGLNEGIGWLEKGLERSSASPKSVRAKALDELGYLLVWRGDLEKAAALLEESFAISKELGDRTRIAGSLFQLGNSLLQLRGDRGRIESLRQEAEALRRETLDSPQAVAPLLLFLGFSEVWYRGNRERMVELLEEALVLFRELGDLRGIGMCLAVMGQTALDEGDLERATPMFEEAMSVLRELKDKMGTFYSLLGLAGIAGSRGDAARAARLWGAAEALREASGFIMSPTTRSGFAYERHLAHARSQLDEAAWDVAWSEGQAMTPEQAVEYALSKEEPRTTAPLPERTPVGESPAALTRREREVAVLIAKEMTNRQIAEELVISEHTATTHVRNILKKLGLRSRTQIGAWVAERHLLPEEDQN